MPIAYPQTGVRYAEWFTAGTFTFVVPSTASGAMLDMCGGGGGGAPGFASATQASGGGGGGSGGTLVNFPLVLVPGSTLTIIVGAGGNGGTVGNTDTTAGGATSIAATLAGGPYTLDRKSTRLNSSHV